MADFSWAGAVPLGPAMASDSAAQMDYIRAHPGKIVVGDGPSGWGAYWFSPQLDAANVIAAQAEEDPLVAAARRVFPGALTITPNHATIPPQVQVDGRWYVYEAGQFTDLAKMMQNATQSLTAALNSSSYVQGSTLTYDASIERQLVLEAAKAAAQTTAAAQAGGVTPAELDQARVGSAASAIIVPDATVLPAAAINFTGPATPGPAVPQLQASGSSSAPGDVALTGGPVGVATGSGQAGTASAGLSVNLGLWEFALVLLVGLELFADWPIPIRRRA